MSPKEQMLKARSLIQAKRYDEAREILQRINHPKAREWLNKIEGRASAAQSKPRKPTGKPQSAPKSKSAKQAASRKAAAQSNQPSRVFVILAVILVVGLLAGVGLLAVAFLGDSNPPRASSVGDESVEEIARDAESSNEANPDAPAPPASTGPVVGTGQRIPLVDAGYVFTLELPEGWVCDCSMSSGDLEPPPEIDGSIYTDIATYSFDPAYYVDKTLAEAAEDDLSDDEVISSEETVEINGREILVAHITDEDNETSIHYYSKDRNGYILILQIPDWIDEPESMHEAALFIASNIESEPSDAAIAFIEQLMADRVVYDEARNRWVVADLLKPEVEHNTELPPDWTIDSSGTLGFPMAVKNENTEASATAFVYLSHIFDESRPLADIVTEFVANRGEEIQEQQTEQVGEREVFITREFDAETGDTVKNYYVKDSDGDLLALIIQPFVVDPDLLHEDVLFIAGNIEAETVTWEEKLARIDALP